MANTRKMLERVPGEKFAWSPHKKSSTLGKLANHFAAMPILAAAVLNGDAKKMPEAASTAELLEAFEKHLAVGREAIAGASDDHLNATIQALNLTRAELLRDRVMNHMIHHRGQLSVYLRLLDVAVPGMYGPSADER